MSALPNTPARLASLEIDMENRAKRRDREARKRGFGFTAGRVHDLLRFFGFTYGDALPDDDAGREDFFILAQHVAGLNGNPTRNIVRYADRWCPWMGVDELAATVRRVLARPCRWRADTLGESLGLIDEVRTRLAIRTIGAIDVHKEQRQQRRRQRWNAKRRKRTRADYLADSITRAEPWKTEGICRRTWERRRESERPAKRTPHVASPRQQNTFNKMAHTCDPPTPQQAARQQQARRALVRFVLSALSTGRASPRSEEVGFRESECEAPDNCAENPD